LKVLLELIWTCLGGPALAVYDPSGPAAPLPRESWGQLS